MKRTSMKRRTPLKATAPLRRSGPIKKRKRKASEWSRIYGSKARVEWVKSLPCSVRLCAVLTAAPSENAHIETGGMGRKANADTIIPLCRGHHRLLHSWGSVTFQRMCRIDLAAAAADTERQWQLRTKSRTPNPSCRSPVVR